MKNKWRILKILVTVIIFGLLLRFSLKRFNDAPVKDVAVKMISSEKSVYFLDENDIKGIVKNSNPSNKIGDLNIPKMEREITQLNAVDSANVYLNLNGVLNLNIVQKKPVFRLNNGKKDCYIDRNGNQFNTSRKYSHPCMLVSGKVDSMDYLKIIEWIHIIEKDGFAKDYFVGITKEKKDYYLLTNDGHFKVEIGNLENPAFKLKGFKTFAKKYLVFQNQNKYKKISLKYSNQIVTTLNKNYSKE